MSIASNKMAIYPSSQRTGGQDVQSRFTTEFNLTNTITSITDKDSFIYVDTEADLCFVINGYMFRTTKTDFASMISGFSTNDSIYALIVVDDTAPKKLVGWNGTVQSSLDDNDNFIGLTLNSTGTLSPGSGYSVYSLLLGTKTASSWTVNEDAKLKISLNSVFITEDGVDKGITFSEISSSEIDTWWAQP